MKLLARSPAARLEALSAQQAQPTTPFATTSLLPIPVTTRSWWMQVGEDLGKWGNLEVEVKHLLGTFSRKSE